MTDDFVRREFNIITWVEFMEPYNVMYIPEQLTDRKSIDFSNVKQENMFLKDYEQKFIQLESCARGEKVCVNKFVWGLRFILKD